MEKVLLFYRTEDGKEDYHFCFEEQSSGEWRVYILEQPSYGSRPQDLSSTHRQYDSKGKFIDWCYPFESLEEAKQIAALWAEFTQEHINNYNNKKGNRHDKTNHPRRENQDDSPSQDDDQGSFENRQNDWEPERRVWGNPWQ